MKIIKQVERRLAKITKTQKEIEAIRDACPHENLVGVWKGSSGWDYSYYWVDLKCLDCLKRWTEYDNEDGPYYRSNKVKKVQSL
jgi:nitrite reductase/ring-hydroxylating ferredoxin subunit